jgi:hypothetical protein
MGGLDILSMVVALVVMSAGLAAKVLTSQLLNRLERAVGEANHLRQKTLFEHRHARSRRKVAEQNRGMLCKKRSKLKKKIDRLRQELASFRGEAEHRQQVRNTMRDKLVRPTLAAPFLDRSADETSSE